MPTTHEGQEPIDEQAQGTEAEGAEAKAEGSQEGEVTPEENPLWEGIPEDHPVRAEVDKLRRESAAKRTTAQQIKQENEELKGKLEEAKTSEEVAELVRDYDAKVQALEAENTRARVAAEFKLPADLAELLKGESEEDVKAHAETLSRYAPRSTSAPPVEPSGGRVPNEKPTDVDSLMEQVRQHRH